MPYDNAKRQEWVDAGYLSTMGSAAACLPPEKEWIRLYHLLPSEHGISNILNSRLRAARVSDLNDPFELAGLDHRFGNIRKAVAEFRSQFDNDHRLISFSADWKSPVLWSHYAAKHTGICLGFDILRSLVEKVQYESCRLEPELGASDEPAEITPDIQTKLRTTKCNEWSYELEWRMIVSASCVAKEGANDFVCIKANEIILREVILGPRFLAPIGAIRQLTAHFHPDAVVFRSRLAWKYFAVVPLESTVP